MSNPITSHSDGSAGAMRPAGPDLRSETSRVAAVITLLALTGVIVYALLSWSAANRTELILVAAFAMASLLPIGVLRLDRRFSNRTAELMFLAWGILDIGLISALVLLDGGLLSPIILIFPLLLFFGSGTTRRVVTIAIGLAAAASVVAIGAVSGNSAAEIFLAEALLGCAAVLAGWQGKLQARQRRDLKVSVDALERAEKVSNEQVHQQEELARFGQRAILNGDFEETSADAMRTLRGVLGVDIVVLFRYDEDENLLRVIDGDAITRSDLPAGKELAVPVGSGSQAGFTFAEGRSIVSTDCEAEDRFARAELNRSFGIRSGVTSPVKTGGQPWGVIAALTKNPRDFSRSDVRFIEAVGNVLGGSLDVLARERQIEHHALHDSMTGLPNRALFTNRLRRALARARRSGKHVAVVFVDLDDLKLVNDSLGHETGDELIRKVGPRLSEMARTTDTVAHFGGDEFTVMIEEIEEPSAAVEATNRMIEAVNRPVELAGALHQIGATAGIAIGDGAAEPEELMRDAHAALHQGKLHSRGSTILFDQGSRDAAVERLQTEQDLRQAVERGEMVLHYQPINRLPSGEVAGYEALVRWNHPTRGLLYPDLFIGLAERSRLINPIGRWIIAEACRAIAERQKVEPGVFVSINVSGQQLLDPTLPEVIRDCLEQNLLDPRLVKVELTESVLLEAQGPGEDVLHRIEELGIAIMLDDFGTGYSSLSYLKRLPIAGIKLDRSFIANLELEGGDRAIVAATVEIAKALGLKTVAEGVETEQQLTEVGGLACDFAQGYVLGRPSPEMGTQGVAPDHAGAGERRSTATA